MEEKSFDANREMKSLFSKTGRKDLAKKEKDDDEGERDPDYGHMSKKMRRRMKMMDKKN
jgi:hypothetical protein